MFERDEVGVRQNLESNEIEKAAEATTTENPEGVDVVEETKPVRKITAKQIFVGVVDIAFTISLALLAAFTLTKFVAQRTIVDGYSMYPTLDDRDSLICDKIGYKFNDPERYDVVVITQDNGYIIKRIIGLPGENILIDVAGTIYIDGKKLSDDVYGRSPITDAGLAKQSIQLADDEYFVMGDNRNASMDSRIIGPIKRDLILGKAWKMLYPEFGRDIDE